VKFVNYFALLFVIVALAGCQKPKAVASPPAPENPPLPRQAQPTLQEMKIYLGAETLDAELALTPLEQETGLMYRTNITDQTAMLFVFPQPFQASFWMTNCPDSLSAAYITPDGVIEEIHHLEKDDNVPVVASHNNIQYVLEVNDGWFTRHHIGTGTLIRTEKGSLAQTFFPNGQ